MKEKEIKKLGRKELVDIIYQLKQNDTELREEIKTLKEELSDKHIRLSEAGSIAEASLAVSDIFKTAQEAANIYLEEITLLKIEAKKECEAKILAAETRVNDILVEGKKQLATLKAHYQDEYKRLQQLKKEIKELEEKKG